MCSRKSETIIRVRRGLNGYPYSAYGSSGNFIGNFEKLADVRKHWAWEIKQGTVKIVRELQKKKGEQENV